MINNIPLSQYCSGNSFIHNLDARIKMIFSILLFTLTFGTQNYISLTLLFILSIMLTAFSDISPLKYIKNLKYIIIISLFTAIINLFFETEMHWLTSGIITINFSTFKTSIFVFFRLFIIVLSSSAIMFTTSPQEISNAIESLLSPFNHIGVNVQEIAITITISIRFIPILFEETNKIITAQKTRGASFKNKNLFKRINALSKVFIPLCVSSFKKAEDLAIAMESRSYDSTKTRTKFKPFKLNFRDVIFIICILIIFIGVIICNKIMTF